MNPDLPPSSAEVIAQAVSADMARIVRHDPPRSLVLSRRFDVASQVLWPVAASLIGAALATVTAPWPLAVAGAAVGAAAAVSRATSKHLARRARASILRKYGVATYQDGTFELLHRNSPPPPELAATRETLREHGH